jgi:hypothetical protein
MIAFRTIDNSDRPHESSVSGKGDHFFAVLWDSGIGCGDVKAPAMLCAQRY